MIPNRFRRRDDRVNASARFESFSKPTCTSSGVWSAYYTYPGTDYRYGTYSSMDDVVGDNPKPHLGPKLGYRFHPMSRYELNIQAGAGADWEVYNNVLTCSAPNAYNQRFRRVNTGLTLGRVHSGFGFPIDLNGRPVMPMIDQKNYRQAVALAVTSCFSDVGRGGSDSNLYETISEIDKSSAILSDYFKQLNKMFRGNRMLERSKALGNAYLLTRYGVKPLISDISNLCLSINTMMGSVLETSRGKESSFSVETFNTSSNEASTFTITGTVTRTQTVTARAMVLSQYTRDRMDSAGLSVKNLLTLPWELIPYSFVVDWFVNVGDFIGAITPAIGVDQVGSSLTVTTETQDAWKQTGWTLLSPSQTVVTPPSGGYCVATYTQKDRTVGLPAPSIVLKSDFKFDKLTRALDAYALFMQRLR